MAAKKGSDSKGLIITLVLFILATLAFGTSTYFGFAEQENLRKKAAEEKGKADKMAEQRDFYQRQVLVYRALTGHTAGRQDDEIGNAKEQLDGASREKWATEVDYLDALAAIAKTGKLNWVKGSNRPAATYEKLVADERRAADDVRATNAKLADDLAKEKKKVEDADQSAATAAKEYAANLVAANKKAQDDLAALVKSTEDLRANFDALSNKNKAIATKSDDEKGKTAKVVQALEKMTREQRDVIKARQEELELARRKSLDAPKDWHSDWKVISVDRFGRTVYINVGSAHRAVEQLTFSIHGVDASGKPIPESKGSLEVMSVVGERVSQARLTGVKDPNRDPILPGDVLYNPTWSPTLRKRVAIAGIVDLSGDGRDDIQEFLRNLEKQNVIVDAYLDLRDFAVRGPGLSVKTEYLILGDGAEVFNDNLERENKEFVDKLAKSMGQMQDEAVRYGVTPIGLRKYLDMIGYRLPKSVTDRPAGGKSNLSYRSRISIPAQPEAKADAPPRDPPPAEEKPAPPKEDKPAPPEKKEAEKKEEKKDAEKKDAEKNEN